MKKKKKKRKVVIVIKRHKYDIIITNELPFSTCLIVAEIDCWFEPGDVELTAGECPRLVDERTELGVQRKPGYVHRTVTD